MKAAEPASRKRSETGSSAGARNRAVGGLSRGEREDIDRTGTGAGGGNTEQDGFGIVRDGGGPDGAGVEGQIDRLFKDWSVG